MEKAPFKKIWTGPDTGTTPIKATALGFLHNIQENTTREENKARRLQMKSVRTHASMLSDNGDRRWSSPEDEEHLDSFGRQIVL